MRFPRRDSELGLEEQFKASQKKKDRKSIPEGTHCMSKDTEV